MHVACVLCLLHLKLEMGVVVCVGTVHGVREESFVTWDGGSGKKPLINEPTFLLRKLKWGQRKA